MLNKNKFLQGNDTQGCNELQGAFMHMKISFIISSSNEMKKLIWTIERFREYMLRYIAIFAYPVHKGHAQNAL